MCWINFFWILWFKSQNRIYITNFRARGPPLNVIQFQSFLPQNFISIIGMDWTYARLNFMIFIFWLYAKGHPSLYSIGLAFTLSVWLVLYRFGVYSIGLACTLTVWPVLYWCTLLVWACTLSVWRVLYRFGLYSIGFSCTLSVWPSL